MPRSIITGLALSFSVLATACGGDDVATSAEPPSDAADATNEGGHADASATPSDVDASATPSSEAGDTADAKETSDASVSVEADAGPAPTDAGAGESDATRVDGVADESLAGEAGDAALDVGLEGSFESGPDGPPDASGESDMDGASDAPHDVDVSGGTVLLLGGGASTVFAAEFHPGSSWTASTLTGATSDPPAVALTNSSSGLGVIRSNGGAGEVRFTTWSPGRFGTFAAAFSGATEAGSLALAASGSRVNLAYHGADLKHYFASYAGTWNPTAEAIGAGADQSFGPTPASIAMLGANSVVAFSDGSGLLADRTRVGGVWQAVHTYDPGDAGEVLRSRCPSWHPPAGPS